MNNITYNEIIKYTEFAAAVGHDLFDNKATEPVRSSVADTPTKKWLKALTEASDKGNRLAAGVALKLTNLEPLTGKDFALIDKILKRKEKK